MINFYHIDCMEFMKDKPDKCYDLAIVDPPYGIDAGNMTMGSGKHKFSRSPSNSTVGFSKTTPNQATKY